MIFILFFFSVGYDVINIYIHFHCILYNSQNENHECGFTKLLTPLYIMSLCIQIYRLPIDTIGIITIASYQIIKIFCVCIILIRWEPHVYQCLNFSNVRDTLPSCRRNFRAFTVDRHVVVAIIISGWEKKSHHIIHYYCYCYYYYICARQGSAVGQYNNIIQNLE
jgi:hypothetical protein